jgi:hypothetical protein
MLLDLTKSSEDELLDLNGQTATVATAAGRRRSAPSLLRLVNADAVAPVASEGIVPIRRQL